MHSGRRNGHRQCCGDRGGRDWPLNDPYADTSEATPEAFGLDGEAPCVLGLSRGQL